jgi:hypothetical protein
MVPPIYSVFAALALAGNSDEATNIVITKAANANLLLAISPFLLSSLSFGLNHRLGIPSK